VHRFRQSFCELVLQEQKCSSKLLVCLKRSIAENGCPAGPSSSMAIRFSVTDGEVHKEKLALGPVGPVGPFQALQLASKRFDLWLPGALLCFCFPQGQCLESELVFITFSYRTTFWTGGCDLTDVPSDEHPKISNGDCNTVPLQKRGAILLSPVISFGGLCLGIYRWPSPLTTTSSRCTECWSDGTIFTLT
jgi:hypothetical protein